MSADVLRRSVIPQIRRHGRPANTGRVGCASQVPHLLRRNAQKPVAPCGSTTRSPVERDVPRSGPVPVVDLLQPRARPPDHPAAVTRTGARGEMTSPHLPPLDLGLSSLLRSDGLCSRYYIHMPRGSWSDEIARFLEEGEVARARPAA